MVAAPARAELRPGAVLQSGGHGRHPPVGVHDVVLPPRLERRAHAETRLALDRARQPRLIVCQRADRQVQHRQLHPAGDVDADRVRDDRVVRGQHAADRQPVADMRIRHERARHGHRQLARVLHLLQRGRLEVVAPDSVRSVGPPRNERPSRRGVLEQQLREPPIAGIVEKRRRGCGDAAQVIEHGRHAALGRMRVLQNLLGRLSATACRNANLCQVSCLHNGGHSSMLAGPHPRSLSRGDFAPRSGRRRSCDPTLTR